MIESGFSKVQSLVAKQYIASMQTVVRRDSQDLLGSVLSSVESSHEPVFVFNSKDEFLGLVSPYRTLYSSNFPYTTKVSSIALKPPVITEETPIYEVAEHMLATKLYVLPVFNKKGDLVGVIHGKDMLQGVVDDFELLKFVSDTIKLHTPITAPISSSVKDVFHKLKEKGVARIVLVDLEGDLAGIVTRRDLMGSLIKPTSKMRFPKEGTHIGYYSLAGEKKFRQQESIRKYYTKMVDSLPDTTSKEAMISYLITSQNNSVVLIDKSSKPTGFLSIRDILSAIIALRPKEQVRLIIKKPSDLVIKQVVLLLMKESCPQHYLQQ